MAAHTVAAQDGKYDLDFKTENNDGSKVLSGEALGQLYEEFVSKYPVVSIEDPYDQDDWAAYAALTAKVSRSV